jgi:glycosyltransferase involved in cell wall biosynthesis
MKKVLLIGYPFPLRHGGSPRLLGLAKYLPEFGWEPIILTAPLDEKPDPRFRIVETDYHDALGFLARLLKLNPEDDVRKQIKRRLGITSKKSFMDFVLTCAGEIINYPDSDKGWKTFAIKAGDELIRREGINAIISSSAPVTGHIIAHSLKSRHKIPWVADLRDLWTQNSNYIYSPLRKLIDRRLELKTLATADALVTVSRPLVDKLGMLHKGKTIYSITNGFDPETVNIPPAELTAKFTITYTGRIYSGKREPTKLLAALSELVSSRVIDADSLEIRFYGRREDWFEKEVEEFGLSSVTHQYGQVPMDVALQKQRESQLLLLFDWDDPREKGNYTGKIFEYLAAGRPILSTGGSEDNVVAELLRDTGAGIHATTIEATRSALEDFYRQYKSQGRVARRGDEAKTKKYSQREMTKQFSEILSRLV